MRAARIPLEDCTIREFYDPAKRAFIEDMKQKLPINSETKAPLLLVPKRWPRFVPWISFDDYFKGYCPRDEMFNPGEPETRVTVLKYNRDNYGVVEAYIREGNARPTIAR